MALPRDETTFFGRARELEEIARRFDAGARLVTLVGLGGVGKTRLALAAAEKGEAALFVGLIEARSIEAATREIAAAARVRLKAESKARAAADSLAAGLAKRGRLLLVLDNTEQLGAAARELVSALLDGARELRVLATAREPIGARGEEKVVVQPLDEGESIALLRDRARAAAGVVVEISDADARAIVARVDRLPLAIELAASRLETLAPAQLLERLGPGLDVLASRFGTSDGTVASGAAPAMHRTMRATLDWSWELLGDAERSTLAQLGVFAAPFGIEAAEEVVEIDGAEVLDVIESLVKRSLVVRVAGEDGRVRLALYGTVRAWAREKLDVASARARHVEHHLLEAERAATEAYGERAVSALDRLEELLPELVAAFDATHEASPAAATRIVLALQDLLLFRSLYELRAELCAAGVKAAERAGDDRLLARALVAKARVTLEEGRMQDAEAELRRALELASRASDDVTRAEASRSLGWALTALGRADDARAALADALVVHERQGNARGIADANVALGILDALSGRPQEALAHLRAALAIHVEHGDVVRQEKVLGFAALVGHDAREVARGLPRDVLARAPRSSMDVLPAHVAELVRGESDAAQRWQQAIDLYRDGLAAYGRSEADAAVACFDRALAALDRAGVKKGRAAIEAHAAAAFALAGDTAEASARLARARAEAGSDVAVEVFAAAVDVLGGGAPGPARELLERARRPEVATPELTIAASVLESALAALSGPPSREVRGALRVGPESRWLELPRGERVDLVRYGPVRRLLDRLVVARLESPGVALSAEALIEAGWPGERMRHTAGLLRVYSAIRRLRRLGLDAVLITRDDGYLLDANAVVRREQT